MYNQGLKLLFLSHFCLILASQHTSAEIDEALNWELSKQKSGVQVFTAKPRGKKTNAVRILAELPGNSDSVLDLLLNTEKRKRWDQYCIEARLISGINPDLHYLKIHSSDQQQTAYFKFDMPWPVKDRDVILASEWVKTDSGWQVHSKAISESGLSDTKKTTRIIEAWYHWTLTETAEGVTAVDAQMYMDPAGPIPAWLLNHLSTQQPLKIIEALRQQLQHPH